LKTEQRERLLKKERQVVKMFDM